MKKFLLIVITFVVAAMSNSQAQIITKWNSSNKFLKFSVQGSGNYQLQKAGSTTVTNGIFQHGLNTLDLPTTGEYVLSLFPNSEIFKFTFDKEMTTEDRAKFVELSKWGNYKWSSDLSFMFYWCNNLKITASDVPDFSNVANMRYMFLGCSSIITIPNIDLWNTSNVTNMSGLFRAAYKFNDPKINFWDVAKVRDMSEMFASAIDFNQDLDDWNTKSVIDLTSMFNGAIAFNGQINNWNVSAVRDMTAMFRGASNFNKPVNNWNTKSLEYTFRMFEDAVKFNQDVSSWDVSKVRNFNWTFLRASSFNQNLGNWKFYPYSTEMDSFLSDSGMDCTNYALTLKGWLSNQNQRSVSIGVGNLKYGKVGKTFRDQLISKGYSFVGDLYEENCDEVLEVQAHNLERINVVNPVKDILTITGKITIKRIEIYSMGGALIKTLYNNNGSIVDLSTGAYIVKIVSDQGVSSFKILKN